MVLKKILIIASFLLLPIYVLAQHSAYFKHLSVQDGLSQINVLSIYQDETGALWFGSYEGLNRYNGQSFTVIHPSEKNTGLTQNEIMAICGDHKGSIYIQASHDLLRYDTRKQKFKTLLSDEVYNIHHFNDTLWIVTDHALKYRTEQDTVIRTLVSFPESFNGYTPICITHEDYLYIGTSKGVIRLSRSHSQTQKLLLPEVKVQCIYQDSKKNIWVGTRKNGAYRIAPDGSIRNYIHQKKTNNSLSHNDVRCIVEDDFGHLWFGTFYGLNQYMPATDQWNVYLHQDHISSSLSHSSIFALHKDTQGGLWIGTYFGGVNYIHPSSNRSNFYESNPNDSRSLSFPFVGKMQEDNEHNLWICTEGGGLNMLDPKTQKFTRYTSNGSTSGIGHNNLKCIYFHKKNNKLYVGTHTGGLTIFDTHSRTAHTLKNIPGQQNSIPSDVVNSMQYYDGKLVLSTQAGISAMDLATERFQPLSSNPDIRGIIENYIYETFHIDRNHNIWLSSGNGGVSKINLRTGAVKKYHHQSDSPNTIGRFKVLHIFENRKGELFFATTGSGLFKYEPSTDSFFRFSKENNLLLNNYCYQIAESPSGDLFVLHNRGISCLDTDEKKLVNTYLTSYLSFCQGSSIYFTQNGEMFLGGTTGLVSLSATPTASFPEKHSFYFDQLIINNIVIRPDDDSGILSQTMPFTQTIELDHDQNNIMLEFATSNYTQTQYRYEYRLEGFEKEWLPLQSSQITYTNLDPGDYKLTVREIDESQSVCGEHTLDIHIHPPFYANFFAYCLYILIVGLILYAIIRFNNRQMKLQTSLAFERKEKEHIQELNQAKLRFFTNISHEFRTPLTLIIGQIEALLQLNKLSPAMYNRMLRVYRNANHMRTLISELLDFRKQEQGYLKLKVECRDIIAFTKEIYMSFYEYALKEQIVYKFDAPEAPVQVWFDPVQMQKVIINLLSNAFKYTDAKGSISVVIRVQSQNIVIQIKDTGIGIPPESIHRIFDRFYQADSQTSKLSLGTGIGLALVKSIVELHKGTIQVDSEVKEGSCFSIFLQTGNQHFTAEELQAEGTANHAIDTELISLETQNLDEESEDYSLTGKPVILVVEDNEEILEMLKEIFLPIYEVYTAKNGKDGFEQTRSLHPDLVLSDVMMPEMSGKEMCYKIKNSVDLSHIPVILLTAQTSVEYAIEGYMYGADDYITKPFNVKLLISRCNNLVKSRKLLMEKFRSEPMPTTVGNALNQADKELLEKTGVIITANFENPEFNMNSLAAELGLGRNKLYARVKEITGLTPNELTLKLKLDESLRLLKNNPELNISEISDRLGFSSTQYFSKCFKSVFGMSPLIYRKSDASANAGSSSSDQEDIT